MDDHYNDGDDDVDNAIAAVVVVAAAAASDDDDNDDYNSLNENHFQRFVRFNKLLLKHSTHTQLW